MDFNDDNDNDDDNYNNVDVDVLVDSYIDVYLYDIFIFIMNILSFVVISDIVR